MKLRRNVLQPLRMEFHQHPSVAISPSSVHARDYDLISETLRHAFSSSTESRLLQFFSRPQDILKEYSTQRDSSIAGNLFRTANRIQASVDCVVVLSRDQAALGAKAITQACCQPFWNHLSRADRGSKPRMFFIDDSSDNDTIQALLHMLGCHRPTTSNFDPDRWALLVLDSNHGSSNNEQSDEHQPDEKQQSGEKSEKWWQLQAMLSALSKHVANDESEMRQRLMAVIPATGSIAKTLSVYGDYDFFASSDEPAPFQCFGPLGLLPATLLGINIMELLAGGSWMAQHFHEATPDENLILRLLLELKACNESSHHPTTLRIGNPGLIAWQEWYRDLQRMSNRFVAASKQRELSTNKTSQAGSVGEIHVAVDQPRFDPIELGDAVNLQDRSQGNTEDPFRSTCNRGNTTATLRLAQLDELHTGQLMQFMLLLSASSKLIGVSPPIAADLRFSADRGLENLA
jgi:glucose-6-phosphate isomerase